MTTQHTNDPKTIKEDLDESAKEGKFLNDPEEELHLEFKDYEIISPLRISRWENFTHVFDPETKREAVIVSLNREEHLHHFCQLIEDSGEWDSDKEIPILAAKKFREADAQFKKRYENVKKLLPTPFLPHVFAIYQDKHNHDQYFVQLQYADGENFLDCVKRRRLSPLQILGLIKQNFEGLEFMHDNGLLHLRIKSESVWVGFQGRKPTVRFVSWGQAIPLSEAQGNKSGTKHFAAPEVLLEGKPSAQSDYWSLGSLLYQALTGEPPHPEREAAQTHRGLINIAKEERPPLELTAFKQYQNLPEHIAEELKIEKMQFLLTELLKKNPAERAFKTARSVISFIEENWPKLVIGAPESKETISISLR